jgi:hypothetical protein
MFGQRRGDTGRYNLCLKKYGEREGNKVETLNEKEERRKTVVNISVRN